MKYKTLLQSAERQLMSTEDHNVSVCERGESYNDKGILLEESINVSDKHQHVYWFITKNDVSGNLEKESELKERVERISKQYVFQYERGEENGRLHYHLLMWLKVKMRFSALQKLFGKAKIVFIKKPDLNRVRDYCSKEYTRVTEPIYVWPGLKIADTSFLITKEDLNQHQIEIVDKYLEDENPKWGRKIHWYWEPKGNWGKSIAATYMIDQMGAYEVAGGNKDILCGIARHIDNYGKAPRIIIIDIPRISMNQVSYKAIEQLKNGKFFSGKYESGMVRFKRPWIVIFANAPPVEEDTLSEDRWVIERLPPV